jgi:2-polyprenyl-3-methyl-5-hydroxy-6-metoxy-1,4-benzoquinol methylase
MGESGPAVTKPSTLEMIECECPLCGTPGGTVVVEGRDRDHDLQGIFTVRRCEECGHHRLDPRPAEGQLHLLYPDDYLPFVTDLASSPAQDGARSRVRRQAMDFVHLGPPARRKVPPGRRLLEVGCGSGAALYRSARLGWEVKGIEPSESAARAAQARGLNVVNGTDQVVESEEAGRYDEVHAFMVVEHTPDPVQTLVRLRRVLRPNGVLRISVPNFAHRSRKRFGALWHSLHLPRHYQHFTPETISTALDLAGFDVVRIWYQPTNADFWGSIRAQVESGADRHPISFALPWARWIDLATLPFRLVSAQLYGSSRMTVVARPRSQSAAGRTSG